MQESESKRALADKNWLSKPLLLPSSKLAQSITLTLPKKGKLQELASNSVAFMILSTVNRDP